MTERVVQFPARGGRARADAPGRRRRFSGVSLGGVAEGFARFAGIAPGVRREAARVEVSASEGFAPRYPERTPERLRLSLRVDATHRNRERWFFFLPYTFRRLSSYAHRLYPFSTPVARAATDSSPWSSSIPRTPRRAAPRARRRRAPPRRTTSSFIFLRERKTRRPSSAARLRPPPRTPRSIHWSPYDPVGVVNAVS